TPRNNSGRPRQIGHSYPSLGRKRFVTRRKEGLNPLASDGVHRRPEKLLPTRRSSRIAPKQTTPRPARRRRLQERHSHQRTYIGASPLARLSRKALKTALLVRFMTDFPNSWMWSEAFEMLARAERLHREVFRPARSPARRPAWEPPVDMIE